MLFEGHRSDAEKFLKEIDGHYYVYLLCRPDGRPFYVGKGLSKRVLEHEAEARRHHPSNESNPFKCNVIRKIIRQGEQLLYQVDSTYPLSCQRECLEHEAALIAHYGRLHEGGCLTNLAGGIGSMAGAAPFNRERHARTLSGEPENNPERATLNRFLQGIGAVDSVPVKPVGQIARLLATTPHPQPRSPTRRAAYALIASATASANELRPGVRLPRSFSYQGINAVIENGVARDILKAGMASLIPGDTPLAEMFLLEDDQIEVVIRLIGRQALIERGLL